MSVGVGFQGVTVSGNIGASFQKSKSSASGTNHKLARLSADKITLKSGKDTKVKGAKVKGRKITTDVGGDLTVESVQNTYQSKSNSSGGGFNLGIGLGGSSTLGQEVAKIPEQVSKNIASNGKGQSKTAGVSANFSKGSAERAWVDELTEITATEELNINVKGNTHLKGAVIAAVSGNLNLKTGTFTYEDIIDYDRSKNIGGSLNLSHSFGGPKGESQADKTSQTMAGVSDAFKRSSFGVDGSYEKKDKEGITRATVGAGTLNVQDKTKQAELENTDKIQKLANINRDTNATQEITKDERSYVGVYVTDTSVKGVIDIIGTVADAIKQTADRIIENLQIEVTVQERTALEKALKGKASGDITQEEIDICTNGGECLIEGESGVRYDLTSAKVAGWLGATDGDFMRALDEASAGAHGNSLTGRTRHPASTSDRQVVDRQMEIFWRAYIYADQIGDDALKADLVSDIAYTLGGKTALYSNLGMSQGAGLYSVLSAEYQGMFTQNFGAGTEAMINMRWAGILNSNSIGLTSIGVILNRKVPGLGTRIQNSATGNRSPTGADNIATAKKLADYLRLASAKSPFRPNGKLTSEALIKGDQIIAPGRLGNPNIPAGYGKFVSPTFQSPSGDFRVHYYFNPTTKKVFYDLDYKVKFNRRPRPQ